MEMSTGGQLTATGFAGPFERARARLAAADLFPPVGHLLGWTAAVAASSYALRWLASFDGRTFTVVWLAAAPQLVALLTSRRRHWPAYLLAFAVFQYGPAWLVLGQRPDLAALSTLTAVVFAASMLHSDQDWVRGRSDSLRSWRRFVLYGVVAGPALAGVIGAISVAVGARGRTDAGALAVAALMWYLTEAVGIAFVTPVLLRWRRYWRRYSGRALLTSAGFLSLMVALGVVAAVESNFVLMFLTGVPALLVLIEFGIAAAFLQMAVGATVVLSTTFAGIGPFTAATDSPTLAMMHAQVFLLAGYAMVVLVAAALEERNRLTALDHASHEVYDLVAELTGDLVLVVDARGDILHNASAGTTTLSLRPGRIAYSEWQRHVHPDDLHVIAQRVSAGRPGASLPFRVRNRDGSWAWFVVHSRRASRGLSAAILRDVTLEHEVHASLTDMANSDALTGLANRRGLSERARGIWSRAYERDQPLTALFVDVDHFKAFNDCFGHQAGDACLRSVADVLAHLADPDSCVASRYGGEEFAVVLAGCENPYTFAEGLSSAIRALRIPHPAAPSGVVTVSVGVATVHPRDGVLFRGVDPDAAVGQLLDRADKALYAAKASGRNSISVYRDDPANRVLIGEQIHHAGERPRQAAGSGHDE
ncbi:diguanylate cyclase (GGDEF) domain-containing protein [Mycolicibacterium chubuense NBB4]|uniref:Diguanylate cyclase (GGDEF) domain-containing protein n=1 Tax=Mycolicibacterium chubuense (strain NBB4) TaxID=710421 RepID=I4BEF8_MYCCN|nr:diguanylate cyclase [Mycolicibacterium chubuense]AFM15665.1 diguanylate cyclase (GGDEF) domain-containing protein [Mycolicibacterium chubuense NBB4]